MTGDIPNLHSLSPVLASMLPLPCSRGMLKSAVGTLGSVSRVSWKVAFIQGSSKQGKACLAYTGCTAELQFVSAAVRDHRARGGVRQFSRSEGQSTCSHQHRESPACYAAQHMMPASGVQMWMELCLGLRYACLHMGCSQAHLSPISCCVGCQVVPHIFLVHGVAEVEDKCDWSSDEAVKPDGKLTVGSQEGVHVKVACMSKAMH